MTYLTLMLTSVGVVLDSSTSKINILFAIMDEYLQGKSRGDNKHVHSKNHFDINHITNQGVLY